MRKLYFILFLITFTFIISEVFVFGQTIKRFNQRESSTNLYEEAISNVEGAYERTTVDNAAFVKPRTRQLLEFFKRELSSAGGDIESRIDDLDNVLDKIPGLLCTADEEDLNERLIKLNIADDGYEENPSEALRIELDKKERDLRQSIIKAIDHVLQTNGVCDNKPSYIEIVEDR